MNLVGPYGADRRRRRPRIDAPKLTMPSARSCALNSTGTAWSRRAALGATEVNQILALKAFLSLKGCSLKRLAGGEFGHDLESLLSKAEQNGLAALVTLEEHHTFQIRRASSYYANKVFEYPAVFEAMRGYPEYPDSALLISAAERLIPVLREPV